MVAHFNRIILVFWRFISMPFLTHVVGLTDFALQNGTKQTLIFNPPAILTIHLKRFEQVQQLLAVFFCGASF